MSRAIEVSIANANVRPLKLTVEPWARELLVPVDRRARVEFEGPDNVVIEILTREDGLIVYGWTGSILADSSPELL